MHASRRSVTPSRRSTLLAAAFLLFCAAFILGICFGVVPYEASKLHAPLWILAISGLLFGFAGLIVLASVHEPLRRIQGVFGFAILLGMAAIGNWVAFGPGERQFTVGTSSSSPFVQPQQADSLTGRILFGCGAIVLDGVVIALIVRRLRSKG